MNSTYKFRFFPQGKPSRRQDCWTQFEKPPDLEGGTKITEASNHFSDNIPALSFSKRLNYFIFLRRPKLNGCTFPADILQLGVTIVVKAAKEQDSSGICQDAVKFEMLFRNQQGLQALQSYSWLDIVVALSQTAHTFFRMIAPKL